MNHLNPHSQKDDHRKTVGEWLEHKFVWRIPVYQRHYAWNANSESGPIHLFWETVREQTQDRLKGKTPPQHYLGAVLVDNQTERGATDDIKNFHVVDGQQRLTTIQIALLALIKVAKEHGEDIKSELAKYILSDNNPRNPKSRLIPTNFDAQQFQSILFQVYTQLMNFSDHSPSEENANKSKINVTFKFLQEECNNLVKNNKEHDVRSVIDAIKDTLIKGFDLVLIVLRESDKAQLIFESLNNYAEPLTTFDLIRNNVFYRAAKDGKDVEIFYGATWQNLESPYWEEKSDKSKVDPKTHIEAYIARMLVAKIKKDFRFNRNDIFHIYKTEFSTRHPSIDEEIKDLISYTGIYQCLDGANDRVNVRGDNFTNVDFGVFLNSTWKSRDFYPAIFSILDSDASKEDKRRMLKLLESYVIRRGVCDLSVKAYNKHNVNICAEMGDKPSYDALHRMLTSAYKKTALFPTNDMVIRECETKEFYGSHFQRYVFDKIEASMYRPEDEDERTPPGKDLTIDHILPQGWGKNPKWEQMVLGGEGSPSEGLVALQRGADGRYQRGEGSPTEGLVDLYINTIGNLTIMSRKRNSAKSNHPFDDVKGLLASSPLKLNRDLAKKDTWNVEQITQRSKELAEKICEIWPYDIPG